MWQDSTEFHVAVFWPIKNAPTQGSYGGVTICKTLADAEAARERDIRNGYKPELVHIRKITVKRIETE